MASVGRVVRQIASVKPDLVHAHAGHFAYAGVRSGRPTIYTIHGVLSRERQVYSSTLYDRLRYGLLAHLEARALPRVQHLVAISPYVREEYAHVRSSPWTRIDNPVPAGFFQLPNRSEAGRVLYAGSITEIKDLLTLLRAVARVRSEFPEVALRIAGRVTSTDYERRVREYVAEHHLDDVVQFLGLLDREGIMEEYARCCVVALSSLQENAPMAVIEGMAAAKPVVATRVGGVPDLIADGETGFLVAPGDDAAMAERLLRLLQSSSLRARMGQNARKVAQTRFAADRVAKSYYELYRAVLSSA